MVSRARVQIGAITDSGNRTATSTYTFNHTVENQGSRILVVCMGGRKAGAQPDLFGGAYYDGLDPTYSFVSSFAGTTTVSADISFFENPPSGAHEVLISPTALLDQSRAVAFTLWNVNHLPTGRLFGGEGGDPLIVLDTEPVYLSANGENPALDITTETDRAFTVGCYFRSGTASVNPASGQTKIVDLTDSSTYRLGVFTKDVEIPGTTPMDLTSASNFYGYVLLALRARRRRTHGS